MEAAVTGRMRRTAPALWTMAAVLLAAPLSAQEPVDTTASHLVRSGDTLWDLARRYLGDPYRWRDIFQINRDQVDNPDLILPQWRLRIPGLAERTAAGAEAPPIFRDPPGRTVFFETDREAERARLRFSAAASVPAVAEGDFYRAGLLVPEDEVRPVGRLVELVNPSVVPLAIAPQIAPYDRVYMTLARGAAVSVGERMHLLRPGQRIERLGRVFESTGVVRVLAVEGEVATVEVERLYDAVRVGDLAVPLPSFQPRTRTAVEGAGRGLEGRLIAFEEPHPLQNLHDLAFVDLGAASGVEEGDELVVVLPPERREWGMRPEIVVARLRVLRTAQRTASVKVIELEHPALRAGLPVRLVAKMQ